MFFKDIEHIERATRMTPVTPIPLLRIQDKNQNFFDVPVASFREDDIRRIVEIVSNANSGTLLNEWAEETNLMVWLRIRCCDRHRQSIL